MKPALRKRIVREAERVVLATFDGPLHAACVYWTATVLRVAARYGVPLILQAGTAYWRRVPPELDDGLVSTHFGYEWQGLEAPAVRARLAAGVLPELHVWAAHAKRLEIVDLTTRYQAQQCVERTGAEWLEKPLPPYVWCTGSALPAGTVYRPAEDATRYALSVMIKEGLLRRGSEG